MKTLPSTLKDEGKEEKKGKRKGKKKDAQGREEDIFKGAGECFQQFYALKPSPAPLKMRGREEKGEGEEKRCAGKGRKYFQ